LVLRERFSRDLGLWEQMRDCFHDDSVVRISWINASGPEFVRRSKEMAERNVQASHRLGPIFVPGQTVAIDPGALKAFRPSYRFLSYCFASVGYPVPNDLAGVDRPHLVDALVSEIYGWAGLTPPR
jgi:hypothetical protein